MKHIYDDEEFYYEEEQTNLHAKGKKKFKGKGHQFKHRRPQWEIEDDEILGEEEELTAIPETYRPAPKPAPAPRQGGNAAQPQRQGSGFVPGPNTHTIKGNIIDFDRVAAIEKVEGLHNGVQTYGIKFLFSGSRGLFRIAWFNINARERDSVYNAEFAFWSKVRQAQGIQGV